MEFSEYQKRIFSFVESQTENGVVKALAGSGKTFTGTHSVKLLPATARIGYFAFNKKIVDAVKPKMPSYVGVQTLNSFGFGVYRQRGRCQVDGKKTENILKYKVFKSTDGMMNPDDWKLFCKIRNPICRLIGLFKANLYDFFTARAQWKQLADDFGLDLPTSEEAPDFESQLLQTWQISINERYIIDFDDQLYFPVVDEMRIPKFDFIFVDEAQDLNLAQLELIRRSNSRILAVGDPNQAIYGFRGATPDAIDKIIENLKATVLPLSICYRCPKAVIAEAAKIVPEIECGPGAKEGHVEISDDMEVMRKNAQDNDFVLCRTTAPLVRECLKFIRKGQRASVQGRDLGTNLVELINQINNGIANDSIDTFEERLGEYRAMKSERLAKKEDLLAEVNDRLDTLEVIAEESQTVAAMKTRIDSIFSDEKRPGITLATCHRSKGLETDRVFVIHTELLPHPKAKKPWQKTQEKNLKYVAITRAMDSLWLIGEKG